MAEVTPPPEIPHRPLEPEKPETFSDEALLLTDAPVPKRAEPKRDPGQVRIEVIGDWEKLAAMEPEWQQLADHASEPNAFYEPASLLPALRHFAQPGRVEVVVARDDHGLCALFPVAHVNRRIELWRHLYCYLTAPLIRRGRERAAIAAWLDWVKTRTSLVRLEDLPGDGPVRLALIDELNERGWTSLVTEAYSRAILRPARSSEDYLTRALATKRRREFRRQRTKLSELGAVSVTEVAPGEDPRPFIREFLAMEAAGWKGKEGVAAALRASDRAYIEDMVVRSAERGKLQALALRVDGKPVALKVNLFAGEGAFAFKITFDEQFAKFSPGVQLELENIERAHRLPRLRWMDSCAAPNRFMINHLWPDRREMQTLFFSPGSKVGSLVVSMVPVLHFLRRLRKRAC
jgi:CelD/BcsL family acetyltransferase involved in cellulose biosynthesis